VRRALALVAAAALVAAGAVLLLLASDVRDLDRALAADDERFRARPEVPVGWTGPGRVPFDAAARLLAVEDDVAYRRAVQLFWTSAPTEAAEGRRVIERRRVAAAAALGKAARDADPARRGEASNLLGILALVAGADSTTRVDSVQAAAESFRRAVVAAPASEDAKHNLELVLRNTAPKQSGDGTGDEGEDAKPGDKPGGASLSPTGGGY
jgi:hypothetical protein